MKISILEKDRAPSRFLVRKGLGLKLHGDARLPCLELRALPVVHVAAVLELILGEVLAAEVVDAVGSHLAVVRVYLRRQGRRLAQVVVPDVLARAGLKVHEMHALRTHRHFGLRFLLLERNHVRHGSALLSVVVYKISRFSLLPISLAY